MEARSVPGLGFPVASVAELLAEHPGTPAAKVVTSSGKPVAVSRTVARHEVWSGRRFVWVQVESADGALAAPGTVASLTFASRR